MKLDPNNDVYQGDLLTLKRKLQDWASADKTTTMYRTGPWLIVAVGFVVIIYVMLQVKDGTTAQSQLPLHISIWITALLAIIVSRHGKKLAQSPFWKFHMARFEADDDTLYYVFQKGMTLQTYYIKDKKIKKIYRDDTAGVLLIKGDADLNIQTRNGETDEKISEFYALIPFDKYDLDDLLHPYRKKVVNADGQLREQYTQEHRGGKTASADN